MNLTVVRQTVDEILEMYSKFGEADYIGEPVSQIEHMSQAAQLAIDEGYDDEVVLAAFFHDVGHLCVQDPDTFLSMNGFGIRDHEKIGADFLRGKGFPGRIAKLVEGHVQAKRYLTFVDPAYFNALSKASKETLSFQGGVMSADEASRFELEADFRLMIEMRQWDEKAKLTNQPLIDLSVIRAMAIAVLSVAQEKKSGLLRS